MIWILKTGQFYTVSEKRLANLHFFLEKWPNMASPVRIISAKIRAVDRAGRWALFSEEISELSRRSNLQSAAACKRLRRQVHLAIVFTPACPLQST